MIVYPFRFRTLDHGHVACGMWQFFMVRTVDASVAASTEDIFFFKKVRLSAICFCFGEQKPFGAVFVIALQI